MPPNYLYHFTGSKIRFLSQKGNQGRVFCSLLKYSTAASSKKNNLTRIEVEVLDDKINYDHLNALMKKQKDELIAQASHVKNLKDEKGIPDNLQGEIEKLKICKQVYQKLKDQANPSEVFNRDSLLKFVKQKYLYSPSSHIYEPIAGLFDYDATGSRILANIYKEWESHFVNKEKMLTIKCPCITSEHVLQASGHVTKFTNFMIKDSGSTENYRLDHTIKDFLENVLRDQKRSEETKSDAKKYLTTLEGMSLEELMEIVQKFEIKSPSSKKELVDPSELNLMFTVAIGQTGRRAYLRPESAQGIFTKFEKLLRANHNHFPLACAQIGTVFRNEICPGGDLLRLREFNVAEIEQFYYPSEIKFHKISKVANTKVWLYSACNQMDDEKPRLMEIGSAVEKGLIQNEYLAYYMARTQQFFENIGIAPNKLRFRQHIDNEMAHYSSCCWDAECSTSFGWIECVSLSDRGQFDLKQHAIATGNLITVQKKLDSPRLTLRPTLHFDKVKKKHGADVHQVMELMEEMTDNDVTKLKASVDRKRSYSLKGFDITKDMVKSIEENEVFFEDVIPAVIEPSFGMDRIFYILIEHTFRTRETESRHYLCLPPPIAPYKFSVLPLLNTTEYCEIADKIEDELNNMNILSAPHQSTDIRIGKRYVKLDECGVPFAITVDEDTLTQSPQTVTIRERDSTAQVRVPIEDVSDIIRRLTESTLIWSELEKNYKKFTFNK